MALLRRGVRRIPLTRAVAAGEAAAAAAHATAHAIPDSPAGTAADTAAATEARPPAGPADGTAAGAPGRTHAEAPAIPHPPTNGDHAPEPDDAAPEAPRTAPDTAGEEPADTGAAAEPRPLGAAFFDLDNTVMRGASIFHMARGLYARDFFDTRDIARFGWQQARFRLGGEHMGHVGDAQETALSFVKGHSIEEVTALGEEIFDEYMADKIWPGTRALAQMHLDAGRQVWLVTAAPIEIASTIARRLGLTGALGTVSETRGGVYTGRLVGELLHGEAKAEAVRGLAAREGLDLADCSAYSDSANDIPMLSLVGDPCAVNPDGRLRRHARKHGWRTKDYRTGRKAARIGIPAAAGIGAVVGALAAGTAVRRRTAPA